LAVKTPIRLTGIAKNINRVRLFCWCSLVWMLTESQRHQVFGHGGHSWWRYSISTPSELVLTSTFLSYINKFTCNFLLQAFLCSHHHMDSISSKYNIHKRTLFKTSSMIMKNYIVHNTTTLCNGRINSHKGILYSIPDTFCLLIFYLCY
jgi:hypothetical protein